MEGGGKGWREGVERGGGWWREGGGVGVCAGGRGRWVQNYIITTVLNDCYCQATVYRLGKNSLPTIGVCQHPLLLDLLVKSSNTKTSPTATGSYLRARYSAPPPPTHTHTHTCTHTHTHSNAHTQSTNNIDLQ